MPKFLTNLDMSSQRVLNVASPSASTDAANKGYIDNLVAGLSFKEEVRVATTTNGTLATAFANGQTVDGVTLATGNRILLKNQTTQTENGIYVVAASGAPTRSGDADSSADLNNATVYVTEGTVNAGMLYTQTTANPTVGVSNVAFVQFATGVSYTAGNGLQLTSNAFSILLDANPGLSLSGSGIKVASSLAGSGLTYSAGVISVDTSSVVRKFSTSIGTGSSTTLTVTHNLGSRDVQVQLFETASPYGQVYADVVAATANTVEIAFAVAPTSNQFRAVVHV